jgi:Fur family ferric uptake transcriptional regulator
MASNRVEQILASLRERGGRASLPRRVIIEALLDARHHLTVEELATQVQSEHPEIHLTTVYRTVEALEALGVVYHVHLGHGPAQWHLADDAHQHLVCQSCGAVMEAPDQVFEQLRTKLGGEFGFVPDPRHFALVGWCAECRAATTAPESGSVSGSGPGSGPGSVDGR